MSYIQPGVGQAFIENEPNRYHVIDAFNNLFTYYLRIIVTFCNAAKNMLYSMHM